jgi:hypothetical protein
MVDGRMTSDRFRLIAEVGSGGMGSVWRAWDSRIDREVAVKIITLYGMSEADRAMAYHRTVAEARAAAKVSRHPGIAAVYDVFEATDGRPWIVMEFVHGRSLDQIITEFGPLPPAATVSVALQVLDALNEGHAVGVLHRDLKPGNIMITAAGKAVLTDFGIARVAGTPSTTQPGTFLGTPGFAAPERLLGQSTPEADLWSLGATLFAMAAGRNPYSAYTDAQAVIAAVLTEAPLTLPASAPLADLIGALMNREPARRPDAGRTRQALLEFAASLGPRWPADAERWWAVAFPPPTADNRSAEAVQAWHPADSAGAAPGWPPTARLDETITARQHVNPDGAGPEDRQQMTPRPSIGGPRRRRRRQRRRRTFGVAAAIVAVAAGLGVGLWAAQADGNSAAPALDASGAVAAVNADKHPEVFAVTPSGALVHDYYWNGNWGKWTTLTASEGRFTGSPAVIKDPTGRLEVFARSQSGQLMRFWQKTPSAGPWESAGAMGSTTVDGAPCVIKWPRTGLLEVFAELPDGSLGTDMQLTAGTDGAWSGWHSMGGTLGGPPVAAVNTDGHPEVFALAPDGSLLHTYWQPGSESWSAWSVLQAGDFTGTPAVADNAAGELEVFLRTSAGVIDRKQEQKPSLGPWSDPIPMSPAGMRSGPAVYQRPDHTVEVFAESANGTVGHAWELGSGQSSAGWTPWVPLSGAGGGTAGTPVAVSEYGVTTTLVRMAQGDMAVSHATAGGKWSPWTALSGAAF